MNRQILKILKSDNDRSRPSELLMVTSLSVKSPLIRRECLFVRFLDVRYGMGADRVVSLSSYGGMRGIKVCRVKRLEIIVQLQADTIVVLGPTLSSS